LAGIFVLTSEATNGLFSIWETIRSFGGDGKELSAILKDPLHPWHLRILLVMNLKVNGWELLELEEPSCGTCIWWYTEGENCGENFGGNRGE